MPNKNIKSAWQKWRDKLTPEQWEAHLAKLAASRKAAQAAKSNPEPEVSEANHRLNVVAQPTSKGPVGTIGTDLEDVGGGAVEAMLPHRAAEEIRQKLDILDEARSLLDEYLKRTRCLTGGGQPSVGYCQLCIATGSNSAGVHSALCDCPCHQVRALLQRYADQFCEAKDE